MGVISGIGAPRPMTPSEGNRPRTNSWSAPNSPARGGVFPSIHRLPSQDSLDRSIHNESGHGKSVAQIIKDLKKANADLTNQIAEMEVKHMNEMEAATRPNVAKQKKVEDAFLTLKKQMAQLEANKIASESKVKEKDSQLLKAREEANYHRHQSSNLKSQLHQLQNELDDSEGRFDDIEQLLAENEDMKMELEEMRLKLSDADSGEPDSKVTNAVSAFSAADDGIDYFQRWQDTQGELESHRTKLTATKQDLENLQLERDSWHQEQNQRVIELETELQTKSESWSMREQEMQSQIQSMEFDAVEDMQNQILERDDIIVSLNDQLADLAAALGQAKEQSVNEEQYRRDEAEDLRILHDAQEEEIVKLRKKLEDAQKELAFRDEEISEQQTALKKTNADKTEEIERLQKELNDSQQHLHEKSLPPLAPKEGDGSQLIVELEDDLDSARAKIASLEDEIELIKVEMGVENIDSLEREIDDLKRNLEEERQKTTVATAQVVVLQEDIVSLQQRLPGDATLSEEKKVEREENEKLLQEANVEITSLKSTIESMQSSESSKEEKHKKQLREAQLALVSLDEEKEELIKKHGKLLMVVEREKEKVEKDSLKKIATIEDELIVARNLAAKYKEIEAERDTLGKRVASLEEQISSGATRSIDTKLADEQAQYQLDSLREEIQELKEKLKDRDTTISALVRSSMGVEEKMATLENELVEARSSRDEDLITADGEIGELRIEVEAMRLNEQRLRNDLKAMERDLNFAEADAKRWQLALQVDDTPGADQRFQLAALQRNVAELRDKLQERDDTIEALVAENQTAENESKELGSKVMSLTKDLENARVNSSYSDPELRDEIQRLQTENDMFAGQIVEQDEEIQHLVRELRLRDQSVVELERDVQEMAERGGGGGQSREEDAREIQALQGQLAEIQSDLRVRNQQLLQYRQELESIQQQGAFGGDPAMAADMSDLRAMNDDFRIELRELRTELWEAKQAAAAADDLKLELAQAKYAFDEYKRKGESGNEVIVDLRKELESSKKEVEKMKQLEEMLEASKSDSTSKEITQLESFERKSKEKDATIAKLRNELESSRGTKSGHMSKASIRMTELESENKGLQEQFKVELHAKNQQIYALEQTLHAQEQVVHNMRREMNQLQNGVQLNTERRRGDLEELQEEIFVMESKAKRQEREISGLRVRLEEAQLDHRAEVSQLRDFLRRKEQEAPIAKTVMDLENEDRLLEVQERLANFKSHNTKLQEQNLKLNGRLERATIEIQSFASQRGHMVDLEQDNRHLRNQLSDMERVLRSYSQRPPTVTTIPLSRVSTAPSQVPSPVPLSSPSPSPVTVQSSASSTTSSMKSKKSNKSFGGLFKKKKNKAKTGEMKAMPVTPENEDDLHSSF